MRILVLLLCLVLAAAPTAAQQPRSPAPAAAPVRADTSFAGIIRRLSEPGGYFDTDNLVSNEASYLHVMGKLRELGVHGGVYIGVGPDQNFSYIAQVRPELAIIVDIRRDNLLQHLLFKALFELSRDREEYLALLLGRPVPARRDPGRSIEAIVADLDRTLMRQEAFEAAHARVRERIRTYGVELSASDWETIRRFHATFAREGLDLRFQSHGRAPRPEYPTLRRLLLERDLTGRQASYVADEEAFRFVKSLQARNRVIPVVGDLAGDHALAAIARFLEERGLRVSAYYTSNVEFYLAQDGRLDAFMRNVMRLPRDPRSVIIRSVFRMRLPESVPGYASTQLVQRIEALVDEYRAGRIRGYYDLVAAGTRERR
ncbi:MAG TPA: hypothetical protein VIL13_05250 [Longimicrobiales bacterium]|jgi:hypothetical protein